MTQEIDRESIDSLRDSLEATVAQPFASHKLITRTDALLLLQVIKEWEHNEDAHSQGDDLQETSRDDYMFRCSACGVGYDSYSKAPARCPNCNELNVAN
jgi:rubrerythrin